MTGMLCETIRQGRYQSKGRTMDVTGHWKGGGGSTLLRGMGCTRPCILITRKGEGDGGE
jgi:hypothetical protein